MLAESLNALRTLLSAETDSGVRLAMMGAFALVATSDGVVAPEELARMAEVLAADIGSPYRSGNLPHELPLAPEAPSALEKLALELRDDFEGGRGELLALVAGFAEDPSARERIVRAAQAAIVADGRVEVREEVALRDVCNALGLDPAEY